MIDPHAAMDKEVPVSGAVPSRDEARTAEEIDATKRDAIIRRVVADVAAGRNIHLDSPRSPLSRRISDYFKSNEFQMTHAWALKPQNWICPICERTKYDITCVNNTGRILAKLVGHHDHMRAALTLEFNAAFDQHMQGSGDFRSLPRNSYNFSTAFLDFDETWVCEDCNNIESAASKAVGSPKHFSFSPEQIRRFIRPAQPHRPHEFDFGKLQPIWQQTRHSYDRKMRLIGRIIAVYSKHDFAEISEEELVTEVGRDGYFSKSKERDFQVGPDEWKVPGSGEILTTSSVRLLAVALIRPDVQHDVSLIAWRSSTPKSARLPTRTAITRILSTKLYQAGPEIPDTWQCFLCERNKTQSIYVAPDGRTKFLTRGYWIPNVRRPPVEICNHCSAVLKDLTKELAARLAREPRYVHGLITPKQFRGIISARPHQPHEIRQAAAEELVESLIASAPQLDAE